MFSLDKSERNKLDLVRLNHDKTTGSSVTFILLIDEISFISDLIWDKVENLRIGGDYFWFLYVSNV